MVKSLVNGADDESDLDNDNDEIDEKESISYTAVLLTQGKHRFYTAAMPSHLLVQTCIVDPRAENPIEGFQRILDRRRAQEIADYIDIGFGTIPGSIVLSAQPESQLEYVRKARTIRFRKTPSSFLILDGQHRVFGFHLAKKPLRVPVVIYNNLTRAEEARLFMDINTKQKPVPSELILDIKRLAEAETDTEAVMRDVFDAFSTDGSSPLYGLLSPAERASGKLSRATFNQALKSVWATFGDFNAEAIVQILGAYLHACLAGLRIHSADDKITNPTLFRALMLVFPDVAQRVSDRFSNQFTVNNFSNVMIPIFVGAKKNALQKPGSSHKAIGEGFRRSLSSGFALNRSL